MNNIRVVAMKVVKNQFNSHLSVVPTTCNELVIESNQMVNKNANNNRMFMRSKVEFENNKVLESEKPKPNGKRLVAHPSIENLLYETPVSLQHSLNLSQCR